MQNQNRFYEFANFRIDVAKHRLLRDGEPLPVTPKAVEILLLLAQNSGRIVEKDELMAAIWPDTIVEESNLTQTVYVLRKILGQDASGEKFIQTIPKRGYRFLHELRAVADESDLIVKHQTSSCTGIGEEVNPAEQALLRLAMIRSRCVEFSTAFQRQFRFEVFQVAADARDSGDLPAASKNHGGVFRL